MAGLVVGDKLNIGTPVIEAELRHQREIVEDGLGARDGIGFPFYFNGVAAQPGPDAENPFQSARMFSSRVPKRLSMPRLTCTLAVICRWYVMQTSGGIGHTNYVTF